ncbi:RING-H2 finger protein ATL8-like [Canna indica]|uniref:RING-H2 finger protein ATL8-like n=1 Tax=Canna indica TaxID=4628 RepID=A0AAQ3Q8V4_9LILI|nr:RING-H2 finger protein ATL8-like [Canna indica]
MPSPTRFLPSSGHLDSVESPVPASVDSDVIVILVSLFCALICVIGLALVARCARLRPSSAGTSSSSVSTRLLPAPPNKGLKKKILRSLPTLFFEAAEGGGLTECPICLAEFTEQDKIRVLPQCGHGFHVVCIDTWLGSHSSCPSCRRVLAMPTAGSSSADGRR